jgi:serine/threonine protein kinase
VGEDGLFHSLCGAPSYPAPEILSGVGYAGARADIWSCGVVLYKIFVRHTPLQYDKNIGRLLNKILKRDYRYPTRVPFDVREFLFRLLDLNTDTRITMSEIMDDPWFKVGFNGNNLALHDHDNNNNMNISGDEVVDFRKPPCMNAFSVLASWLTRLHLAPLFECSKGLLRFMSKQPVSAIIFKFEEIAKANGFSFRRREWTVNIEGTIFVLEAKIFEVAPSIYAVDVRNTGADTTEYKNFLDHHMISVLEYIVWPWSWHDDDNYDDYDDDDANNDDDDHDNDDDNNHDTRLVYGDDAGPNRKSVHDDDDDGVNQDTKLVHERRRRTPTRRRNHGQARYR